MAERKALSESIKNLVEANKKLRSTLAAQRELLQINPKREHIVIAAQAAADAARTYEAAAADASYKAHKSGYKIENVYVPSRDGLSKPSPYKGPSTMR